MAHIQDRWHVERDGERVRTERYGGKGRWKARRRAPDGTEHSRTFDRKPDAERWLDEQTADVLTGRYVHPRTASRTLAAFAATWLEAQTFDVSTREAVTMRLRNHVLPQLGHLQLQAIKPSTVQAWVKGRADEVAPSYVRVLLANLSSILGAAAADGLIATNPCASKAVKAPKVPERRIVPWPREQVDAVVAAHPAPYRAAPILAAGCGLRQGEVFGVRVEDVDFLRRVLRVRQQVKLVAGRPAIAPPKGGRERDVPLPDAVGEAIAARLERWPADERGLVFTSRQGGMIDRNHYNTNVWRPALVASGVEPMRANGMHALRHHYASVLLEGGVSIRAVAEYLGHADPGFTLRTYTHLMPTSEDRARLVLNAAFGPRSEGAAHSEAAQVRPTP